LDDGAEFFAGLVVAEDCGVEDAGDGGGDGGALDLRFGPSFFADEVGEAAEEVRDGDGDLVEEEDAFEEYASGEDTQAEKHPHEGAAFLEIIDHRGED
jgi:hypothetical protein